MFQPNVKALFTIVKHFLNIFALLPHCLKYQYIKKSGVNYIYQQQKICIKPFWENASQKCVSNKLLYWSKRNGTIETLDPPFLIYKTPPKPQRSLMMTSSTGIQVIIIKQHLVFENCTWINAGSCYQIFIPLHSTINVFFLIIECKY